MECTDVTGVNGEICRNCVTGSHVRFIDVNLAAGTKQVVQTNTMNNILFVLGGMVEITYNNFPTTVFASETMILIPSYTQYTLKVLSPAYIVYFQYETINNQCDYKEMEVLKQYCNDKAYVFKGLPVKKILRVYLEGFMMYSKEGAILNCGSMHKSKQHELFLLLRSYYTYTELAQLFYPALFGVSEFRGMVMSQFAKCRTVRELALLCGYSVRNFTRLFTQYFQEPPYKWIMKQNAIEIEQKLKQGDVPLKTIIEDFNFSSASHLTKFCKNMLGATPMEIRRKAIDKKGTKKQDAAK